ncbi:MAG: hypothetical protein GX597_16210 [Anaerolineaceae bacterium]|nr:hypothetical protein [Anaerolineaceae bacterium]
MSAVIAMSTLLCVLLASVPAHAADPAAAPAAQEACGPHVYLDVHHNSVDPDLALLANLVIDGLDGTFDVKDQPIDAAALQGYNVLLVAYPEVAFAPAEISAVAGFVRDGGRLIVLGEWASFVPPTHANALLEGVGAGITIHFGTVNDPTDNEGGAAYWPVIHQFAAHPLVQGVGEVATYAGASLSVIGPAVALASGDADSYTGSMALRGEASSEGGEIAGVTPQDLVPGAPIVMAFARVGMGSVFVTGDSNLWSGSDTDGDGAVNLNERNNRQLAYNVLDYPWCDFPCGPHVYFDIHHNSTGYPGDLSALADLAVWDLDGTVAVKDQAIDAAALEGYNVLLVAYPEVAFTPAEIAAIAGFVQDGGRLIVLGEWGPFVPPTHANALLEGVGTGITINADTVYDPTNNEDATAMWPVIHQFAAHPLVQGVGEVATYAGASLTVIGPAVALASGDADSYAAVVALRGEASSEGGEIAGATPQDLVPGAPIVMAFARVGMGSVFVTGDSSLWSGSDTDGDGAVNLNERNNRQLAYNVLDYPWCVVPGCRQILFDETHGWASDGLIGDYTIEAGFRELAAFLQRRGHIVHSLQDPAPLDLPTLGRYDVLVLMLPKEAYTVPEKEAIARWVRDGGRLVTVSDWTTWANPSPDILNEVHAYVGDGLIHAADNVQDPTDHAADTILWPLIHEFAPEPVNQGVRIVLSLAAASVQVSSPAFGTAFGDDDTVAIPTMAAARGSTGVSGAEAAPAPAERAIQPVVMQAMAPVGQGDVWAIGDANLWGSSDLLGGGAFILYNYNNARLAHNVLAFGETCQRCRVALFKDADPWALRDADARSQAGPATSQEPAITPADILSLADANEQVMHMRNIPYDVWTTADVGAVDLAPYCRVIVASAQTHAFYAAISSDRAWLESWVAAGGILEFHGATYIYESWAGLPMPGGWTMLDEAQDDVTVLIDDHPILNQPNAIDPAALDSWAFSSHGHLIDLPWVTRRIVAGEPSGEPATVEIALGRGCVIATTQTLEWAWANDYSPLLENVILLPGCTITRLHLPLIVRDYP